MVVYAAGPQLVVEVRIEVLSCGKMLMVSMFGEP